MDGFKYYDQYDERILVVASLLIATVVLFILTFFLGCGKDGTHPGTLDSITYTSPKDILQTTIHEYTKLFKDDTTGTIVEIGWKTRCGTNGCINLSADVILMDNTKNCVVHTLLPNDPLNTTLDKNNVGVTDVILTFEMPSMLDRELHIHHYHLFADGTTEQL